MDLGKFMPALTQTTRQKVEYTASVVALGSADYWMYCQLQQRIMPLTEHHEPATQESERQFLTCHRLETFVNVQLVDCEVKLWHNPYEIMVPRCNSQLVCYLT